ncbi:hypothetical protein ACQ4LE_000368 [Meloidogyne hapla]|uniref:Uncharacterized protein n=1 Tax=Meloidogyne hapla TaxID=6305 RepID=A0A1I8BEB2_MELHA
MLHSFKYLLIVVICEVLIILCSANKEQHSLLETKTKFNMPQGLIPKEMEKRRLFSLYSILNNKRSDSDFLGGFDALPVNTRSLEGIRNNCYFSPIQCYYMDERKRRSV